MPSVFWLLDVWYMCKRPDRKSGPFLSLWILPSNFPMFTHYLGKIRTDKYIFTSLIRVTSSIMTNTLTHSAMCKIGQTWSCWRTTDFAFFSKWSSHIWTSQILTGISLLTLRFLGTEICGSVSIWLKPAPLQPAWLRFMKKTSWEIPAAIFGHCQAKTHPLASQKIWFALWVMLYIFIIPSYNHI